jgi:hypothetical protein
MAIINVTMVERAHLSYFLPKSGSINEVRTYQKWDAELKMTPEELEIEKSFSQMRDKDARDKAINDWFNTKKEIEISYELLKFLADAIEDRNNSGAIGIEDPIDLYLEILNYGK